MTCHGWSDNSELQEMNNIELSRRGYVVLSVDMYGHGDSDNVEANSWWDEENAGNGVYDGVKLVASLPCVDTAQIGITGHSNGAYASNITVLLDNKAQEQLISAVLINCNDALYTKTIYYGEYYPESDTRYTNWYGSRDAGIIAVQKEEVFHRLYLNNGKLTSPGDFINQPTAQSFLHFGQNPGGLEHRDNAAFYTETVDGKDAFRIIYTPNLNHVMGFFSTQAAKCVIDFFGQTFNAPNPIASSSQIWQWKVLFSAIGVAGFFMFLTSFILTMLETRPFAMLKAKQTIQAVDVTAGEKKWFWNGLTVCGIFSIIAYFAAFIIGIVFRPEFFHQERSLVMSYWSVACGLFTLLLLFLNYRKCPRTVKPNLYQRGVLMEKNKIWKSIILGSTTALSAYLLVFLADYLFKVDFRFWFIIALRAFDADKIAEMLKYFPFLLIFYSIQSVAINSFNFIKIGKHEWSNLLIVSLFGISGPVILLAGAYGYFFATGLMPTDYLAWGTGSMFFWLCPMLLMLPVFTVISRIIYKATNNPYISSVAFSIVATVALCTNAMTVL